MPSTEWRCAVTGLRQLPNDGVLPDMTASPRQDLSVGLVISLGLHAAALLLVPYLEHPRPQPQLRMEVELAQVAEARHETLPLPVPPQPPDMPEPQPRSQPREKPVPKEKSAALPVLTARQETPAPDDYVAEEIPTPAAVENVPPNTAPTELPVEPAESSPLREKSAPSAVARRESPEEAGTDEAWQGYGQLLHDMVGKNKKYPQIAIRRNWQGRVTVSARISMGKLIDIALIDSSGHKVLDEEALAMVRKAVNVLPVKDGLANKSFTVVVPVDFRLEG